MEKRTGLNKKVATIFKDLPELEKKQDSAEDSQEDFNVSLDELKAKTPRPKKVSRFGSFFSKNITGIHISSSLIKILQLQQGQQGKLSLLQAREIKIDAADFYKSLESGFKKLIRQCGIKRGSEVNVVIETSSVSIHYLSIPKVSQKKIHETLTWELSKISPIPLDKSYMDYSLIDDSSLREGQMRIACSICPREAISTIVTFIEDQGLDIKYMMPVPCSLSSFMSFYAPTSKKDHSIIANIDNDSTTICFFQGNILHYSRQIPIGKNHFIHALQTPLKLEDSLLTLPETSANTVISTIGIPLEDKDSFQTAGHTIPHHHLLSLIRPTLEKLINEIQLSINFYKNNYGASAFKNFFMSGELGNLRNLDKLLIKAMGTTIQVVNPFKIGEISITEETSELVKEKPFSFTVVFGVCMHPKQALDLLPKEIKLKRTVKKVRTSVNIIFVGAVILMVVLFLAFKVYINKIDRILIDSQKNILPLELAEKKIYQYHALKNQNAHEENILNTLKKGTVRWDNILIELSRTTPDGISLLEVLNKSENILVITGEHTSTAESQETAISQFLVNLKNSSLFSKVKLNKSEKKVIDGNERTYFNISCEI